MSFSQKEKSPILDLRCPHCKNTMKYQSVKPVLAGKRKRCVYCGKSFLVSSKNMA